jgi:hypothetical protein
MYPIMYTRGGCNILVYRKASFNMCAELFSSSLPVRQSKKFQTSLCASLPLSNM